MTKPRRKEILMIESSSARSVCFSKRRKGLFKKADDLRKLNPNFSVTAIVFSPAGTPFVYGDTSSLRHVIGSAPSDLPCHRRDEIGDLIAVDISRLGLAELESHARELQRLRSNLEGTDGLEDGFLRFPESGVNSEILNFQPGSEFVGVNEGFGNVSELEVDFGLDLDDFSISDFGSQFADYDDIDGFLNLSELRDVESEKEVCSMFLEDDKSSINISGSEVNFKDDDDIEALLREFVNDGNMDCSYGCF